MMRSALVVLALPALVEGGCTIQVLSPPPSPSLSLLLSLTLHSLSLSPSLPPAFPPPSLSDSVSLLCVSLGQASKGCFSDPVNGRVMGDPAAQGGMTREYCAQVCANKKMPLAGVEFATQCMCGTAVKAGATKSNGCTMACSGDAKETCGGGDAIDVFSFTCSGTPVPKPKPPPPPPPCCNTTYCNNPPGSSCASELYNPCVVPGSPQSSMPFCNYSLPIDVRAKDAVSRMTLAEKIANLDTGGAPIAALGLPGYNWWSEASSGVASGRNTQTTKFAFPITTGMSFNRTLWQVTGNTIGREARAMMNAGNGLSTFWAPVINLAREPRWGRNIEVCLSLRLSVCLCLSLSVSLHYRPLSSHCRSSL